MKYIKLFEADVDNPFHEDWDETEDKEQKKTFRSKYTIGEICKCGNDAYHKVEEHVFNDDPFPDRHELTTYLCPDCFADLMGPVRWR